MIINVDYSEKKWIYRYKFLKLLPKVFYPFWLSYIYKQKFGDNLNLKNPQKMSEKLLKSCITDISPLKSKLADKLEAKKYVSSLIPELSIAEVYQVADSFEELDFSKLQNSFVLKTNHAWKSNALVENKESLTNEDIRKYAEYYKNVLKVNYAYWGNLELQYKDIKPKIYAEEYLTSIDGYSLIKEYEVYCFKGNPEFINYVISYSGDPNKLEMPEEKCDFAKARIFNKNWKKVDFKIRYENDIQSPDTPNKSLIMEYARKLSTEFDFVRVDLFEVDNKLYFGEFTFTPQACFIDFYPREKDLFYGKKM